MTAAEKQLYQIETVMTREYRLKKAAREVGRDHIWTEALYVELVLSESIPLPQCEELASSLREADRDNVETDRALTARRYL